MWPGVFGVGFDSGLQVGHVDIALIITTDGHDLHASHDRAGGIGAVGAGGDEAHVAMGIPAGRMVSADREETGVFALGPRVGLERNGVETRDVGEPGFQVLNDALIPPGLFARGEGMELADLGPRHGKHLAGGVEFHGARTQRDHRMAERKILGLELFDVAQQFVLGVELVEHRMREKTGLPGKGGGEVDGIRHRVGGRQFSLRPEATQQIGQVVQRGGFVEGNAHRAFVNATQVESTGLGGGLHAFRLHVPDRQGIEGRGAVYGRTDLAQALGQHGGEQFGATGDAPQAIGAVIDGIHRSHDGEQHLGGADVGRGFVATDVLLAGDEGEAQGGVAVTILGNANEAAGHLALEGVAGGEETGVRPTKTEGHPKALGGTDRDIRAEFTRRLEQGERE